MSPGHVITGPKPGKHSLCLFTGKHSVSSTTRVASPLVSCVYSSIIKIKVSLPVNMNIPRKWNTFQSTGIHIITWKWHCFSSVFTNWKIFVSLLFYLPKTSFSPQQLTVYRILAGTWWTTLHTKIHKRKCRHKSSIVDGCSYTLETCCNFLMRWLLKENQDLWHKYLVTGGFNVCITLAFNHQSGPDLSIIYLK